MSRSTCCLQQRVCNNMRFVLCGCFISSKVEARKEYKVELVLKHFLVM
jgi:hypothetical protein